MAPFDDLPLPHVDPVTRVGAVLRGARVGAIRLPPGAVAPVRQRLFAAWQRRRETPGEAEEAAAGAEAPPPSLEVDPPETYGEHGELHPAHGAEPGGPHVDLEA